MQLPLPFELPDLSALMQSLAALPPEKWVSLLTGPAALGVGVLLRRFFPSWGLGRPLFTSRLDKKLSLLTYAFYKFPTSLLPLLLGLLSWTLKHDPWTIFCLLSVGVTGLLYHGFRHNEVRSGVRFYENYFTVDGRAHRYDTIVSVTRDERLFVFRTKKFHFTLTPAQHEQLQPSLWKYGYAEPESRSSLDLK